MITERHNVACRLIIKAISKGSLAGFWSIWMPAVLPVWPNKTFLGMLVTGQYPAGFLMLVYLLEIDSPLVALMPILVTPLPTKNLKSPTTPHLHQVSDPRQASRDERRVHELNVNKREMHLVEVEYCEDTRPGDQLEATKKQLKFFVSA